MSHDQVCLDVGRRLYDVNLCNAVISVSKSD